MTRHKWVFALAAMVLPAAPAAAQGPYTFDLLKEQYRNPETVKEAELVEKIRTRCVAFVPTRSRIASLDSVRSTTGPIDEALRKPCIRNARIESTEDASTLLERYPTDSAAQMINSFTQGCPKGLDEDSLRMLRGKKLQLREFVRLADACRIDYRGPLVAGVWDIGFSPLRSGGAIRNYGFRFQGNYGANYRVLWRAKDGIHVTIWGGQTGREHDNRDLEFDAGGSFKLNEVGLSLRWLHRCKKETLCNNRIVHERRQFIEGGWSYSWLEGAIKAPNAAATPMMIRGPMYSLRYGMLFFPWQRLTVAPYAGIGFHDFGDLHIWLPGEDVTDKLTGGSFRFLGGVQFMVKPW